MAAPITTTATTLEGQVLEVARSLQELELNIPPDNRPNNVSIAPDFEALTVTISITLPIVLSGTGNQVSFAAGTYLS